MSRPRPVPAASSAIALLLFAGSGEVRSQERRPKDIDKPIGRLYTAPEDVERYVRSQGITTVEGFLEHLDSLMLAIELTSRRASSEGQALSPCHRLRGDSIPSTFSTSRPTNASQSR